jgi:hypothetical protein
VDVSAPSRGDVRSDERRWDSLTAPRLVFPHVFKEDESLMGGIYRAAADCVMGSTHQLLVAMGAPHAHWYALAWLDVDAGRIAHVLGSNHDEITKRLYRPTYRGRHRSRLSLFGASIMPSDLLHRPRLVAPRAIAASGHQRAIWAHELLPFSQETGEFLISACPRCTTALGWATCDAVESCHSCGFDLREHKADLVDPESLETVAAVARLLDPIAAVRKPAVAALPESLRQADPGDAFEFIWRLGAAFTPGSPGRQAVCRLKPDEVVHNLRTGADLLANWPETLLARLRKDAISDPDGACRTSVKLAAMAHDKPIIPESHRVMIRKISGRGRLGPQIFLKAAAPGAMGNGETARHLGTTEKIVAAMRDRGAIPGVHIGGSHNKFALHEAGELEQIKALLADGTPITRVSQALGVTRNGAEQLDAMGQIGRLHDQAIVGLFKVPRVSRAALNLLALDLHTQSTTIPDQELTVTLRSAIRKIGGREKPWGPLIKAMRSRALQFKLSEANPLALPLALIRARDVELVASLAFDEADHPGYVFSDVIPCIDALQVLNVSFETLEKFLGTGDSLRRAPMRQLYRADVLELARAVISPSELTARWSNYGPARPSFFKDRDFDRTNALGWPRAEVEALADRATLDRLRGGASPQTEPQRRTGEKL